MIVLLAIVAFLVFVSAKHIRKLVVRYQKMMRGEWVKPLFSYTVPYGSHTIWVYTYDGSPLEGIALNTPFELEVMPGECTMRSIYTPTVWTGIGALRYQGKMVGFMTDAGPRGEILTDLAKRHRHVFVYGNIRGHSTGGWPLVSVRVPSTTELRKLR